MQFRWILVTLTGALLLFASVGSAAEDAKPAAKPPASTTTKGIPTKAGAQEKKPKPVEINSATAAQLKKVPGIGDAEAEKIIKNRPYPTRAHLVTKEALPYEKYLEVKDYFTVVAPDPKTVKK